MRSNTPPRISLHNLDEEEVIDEGDIDFLDDYDDLGQISDENDNDESNFVYQRGNAVENLDERGIPVMANEQIIGDYDDDDDDDVDPTNNCDINKPVRDDSILTFKKHALPVFCGSIHPEKNICVTGGEDDKAYVWDLINGEVLHEICHNDTVISACFSNDGNYLATGDMAGEIRVFKLNSNFKQVWEYSMGDMCWLKWHTSSNVLMAGADSGEIYVWRIPSGDCKVLPGNGEKCETAELSRDGVKLFAGYGNGVVKLWDIKSCTTLVEVNQNNSVNHHKECVSSVGCDPEKSLYVSGSEDGVILVTSDFGPICSLNQSGSSVESVAFCPDNNLKVVATGTLQGQISIWDTIRHSLRTTCTITDPDTSTENGITVLKWLPQQTLVSGTLNGSIFGFDGRSGIQKFSLHGHVCEVYDMHYRDQENILLTASEDGTAKIFKVPL